MSKNQDVRSHCLKYDFRIARLFSFCQTMSVGIFELVPRKSWPKGPLKPGPVKIRVTALGIFDSMTQLNTSVRLILDRLNEFNESAHPVIFISEIFPKKNYSIEEFIRCAKQHRVFN